jgi:mannose-6-phosphate isomerase
VRLTMELLFLEPIFKERIWGGTRLGTDFGYPIPSAHTGECWAISAHKNGETRIKNGKFAGTLLSTLWREHPEFFANTTVREFPLMIKILDADTDLSVQVHPDDKYAKEVENDLGKAECWYVLDAKPGAHIIYGHSAKSINEFKQLAMANKWQQLLTHVPVKRGDFFDVPTGTVHALGAGTLILEVQQSSDTTYRLYDYDRQDDKGNLRELHLEKSFAVIKAPHINTQKEPSITKLGGSATITKLTSNKYFQVQKLTVIGDFCYPVDARYLLVSAIEGSAIINGYPVNKGDNFIVTNKTLELDIDGNISLIISNEAN